MKSKCISLVKKEPMLGASLFAAIVSLFITAPGKQLIAAIDWKTLAILFMLLSVLDGFKNQHLFNPIISLSSKIKTQVGLSFFLVFGVFFSSMFVTNDVSLIIFVPLTILIFRSSGKERYILPILAMENIAAVRGSLLTPFGSPQNLFLFSQSKMNALSFIKMMLPLWLMSIVLLSVFILFLYRKNLGETLGTIVVENDGGDRIVGTVYVLLFALVVGTIVSQTDRWPLVLAVVAAVLLVFDRKVFARVDYVLLLTFFCFFVFSSSIAANPAISAFLKQSVAGNEYLWSIGLSQIISNVPASIVLWPFTQNLSALIYGLDTAGLVSVIGSLASVINLRLYTREYPGRAMDFLKCFEVVCLAFFAIVFFPQMLLY